MLHGLACSIPKELTCLIQSLHPFPCVFHWSGFQGLGDKIGLSLAPTLPLLPNLASLILRDNRLTDASLVRMVHARCFRVTAIRWFVPAFAYLCPAARVTDYLERHSS